MMSISNIVVRRGCRKACSSALMRQRLSRATAIIAPPNHHPDLTMCRRQLTNSPPSIVVDRSLSPRQAAALEESILKELQQSLQDTILKTDIRTLGWLKNVTINNKVVKVVLRLPTLLHPHLKELESDIQRIVSQKVPPGFTVQVDTSATQPIPFVRNIQEHTELISNLGPGLSNVSHFLAVYSCKGGVGKSTVAVNLAYELARMGGRVGLLDVDIYGPSLPILVHPDHPEVHQSSLGPGMVKPITHQGVKLMSLGYVSPNSGVPGSGPDGGAAVMRGPMAGRVVTQLLKGTDWGDLDVLVLDMPPGTGDVHLAICQELQLSGAVSVTTPSKLAATDARKGIEMFTSLGVHTLAAVENMAYFECDGGGKHYPFGEGIKKLAEDEEFSKTDIFQLPISTHTNQANDGGTPLCLARPTEASMELSVFEMLAKKVAHELLLLQHGRASSKEAPGSKVSMSIGGNISEHFDIGSIQVSVDNTSESFLVRLFSEKGATQIKVTGKELRQRHPKTGDKLEVDSDEEEVTSSSESTGTAARAKEMVQYHSAKPRAKLFPAKITKKGRYGYSVEWADGATIIYSMTSIATAAGGKVNNE